MSVSLLVKLLISFPRLAEALRGLMDSYEDHLYAKRHGNMRVVIDDWMRSESSSDTPPLLFREIGPTKLYPNPETNGGGDVTLHQRLRERCPINAKDCPFATDTL